MSVSSLYGRVFIGIGANWCFDDVRGIRSIDGEAPVILIIFDYDTP